MRAKTTTQISSKIKVLFLLAIYHISNDVLDVLKNTLEEEKSSVVKLYKYDY